MGRALAHRGPDDRDHLCEAVGLAHRRLSIFDLSSRGRQPMVRHCGNFVIVHNGEVYNWPEIREELAFDGWASRTDTETVLQAYVERGPACLALFNGMFAFAVWDRRERSLFLARDRVGIKPLLYAETEDEFLFASEAKALFAVGYPKRASEAALYDYLRWGAMDAAEETFFEGVRQLSPGCWMKLEAGGARRTGRYWDLAEIVRNSAPVDVDEAVSAYRDLLSRSIALRSRADVAAGAFLSGGIDSSIVTAELAKARPSGVCAFTYDFDTGDAGSDGGRCQPHGPNHYRPTSQ